MRDYAQRLAPQHHIAAVAPTVMMGQSRISPKVTVRWGKSVDPPPDFNGEERKELVLVNTRLASSPGGAFGDWWLQPRLLARFLGPLSLSHAGAKGFSVSGSRRIFSSSTMCR